MKKITNTFAVLLVLLFSSQFVNAQTTSTPAPCDPCAGMPWTTDNYVTTTMTVSAPAGCPYTVRIHYKTRMCNGKLQVECEFPGDVTIEDANPPGSGCDLHCAQVPELMKKVYTYIQGLNGNATIIRSLPSPCFYTGTIVVPDAARVCMGMVPGSTINVLVPCDPNGCCYAELVHVMTPTGPSYIQNVISGTACPPTAVVPASGTINWSCDILGGGSATFTVPFTPDNPLVCHTICAPGIAKADPSSVETLDLKTIITNLKIYPNPVDDDLKISFSTAEANMPVKVELFDVSGRTVVNKEYKATTGSQTISVDMTALPQGSYGLRLSYKSETITTKIAK